MHVYTHEHTHTCTETHIYKSAHIYIWRDQIHSHTLHGCPCMYIQTHFTGNTYAHKSIEHTNIHMQATQRHKYVHNAYTQKQMHT